MSVRPSTKSLGVWVCSMTQSKVKVMIQKLRKCLISECVSYATMHVIKRLSVNYAPRQYREQIFDMRPGLVSRDLQNKAVCYKESTSSPVWGLFIIYYRVSFSDISISENGNCLI